MAAPAAHDAVARALEELHRAERRRYPVPLFALRAGVRDGVVTLAGRALLARQAADALRAVRAAAAGLRVRTAIEVIEERRAAGRVRPRRAAAWLRAHPAARAPVASEALREEPPLGRLLDRGGWILARRFDGTLGWLRASDVDPAPAGPARTARRRDGDVVAAARACLGARYVWGGVGGAGFDCSGLVQTAYRRARGLALPRHSTDLARAARPVRGRPRPGDLALAPAPETGSLHVGLVAAPGRVVHASFRLGAVVEEPLAAFAAGAAVRQRRVD